MFGFKKNDSASSDKLNFNTQGESVPLHTMQDDLDELKGVTVEEKKKENLDLVVPVEEKTYSSDENKYTDTPKQDTESSKSYSPFLNSPSPPKLPPLPEDKKKPIEEEHPKHHIKWGKILLISASFIAVIVLVAGGYYFWITREIQAPVIEPVEIPPVDNSVVVEENAGRFSIDKPNYLSINTETDTAQTIREVLIQDASEIKESGASVPVEFIITDADNDPVAFPIFAILSGLKLSPVLDNLGEEFSLFIYKDSENVLLGLAINIEEDKEKTVTAMSTKEKTLVNDLSFLLLDNTSQTTGRIFNSSTYNDRGIRYINLDTEGKGDLSVDYAFTENQLVIGTSKNTIRSILDKIGKETKENE